MEMKKHLDLRTFEMLAVLALGSAGWGCGDPPPSSEVTREATEEVIMTSEQAEEERRHLVTRYIEDESYTGFESEADGVNHVAFITDDLEGTIEFYTQVVRLKLLRVRAMDGDPASTQVFFDMGRGELLAFLRLSRVREEAKVGIGGFHHAALTINREQYEAAKKRLDEREIVYTTISHEILDTITLQDPNGITLELSVWNIDPKDVQM
jgi:catechol 2,3-dioxygenase-like lactoylglutathione lyase family enzyme